MSRVCLSALNNKESTTFRSWLVVHRSYNTFIALHLPACSNRVTMLVFLVQAAVKNTDIYIIQLFKYIFYINGSKVYVTNTPQNDVLCL